MSPIETCLVTFIIIPDLFLLPNQDYTVYKTSGFDPFVFFSKIYSVCFQLHTWCSLSIFLKSHTWICLKIASLPTISGHWKIWISDCMIKTRSSPENHGNINVIQKKKNMARGFWTMAGRCPKLDETMDPWMQPMVPGLHQAPRAFSPSNCDGQSVRSQDT